MGRSPLSASGRLCGGLAFPALLGAWITQLTGGTILGMGQQHLFNDATVLALVCIAGLLDGIVHSKGRECIDSLRNRRSH